MLVLSDNDVVRVVEVLRRILESDEWSEYSRLVGVRFTRFDEQGLLRDAPDKLVWETCQALGALLITANRAGGVDSLDAVIGRLAHPGSLPVITVADPQRVLRDKDYAERTAAQRLDFLDRIDTLRGIGRLFIP